MVEEEYIIFSTKEVKKETTSGEGCSWELLWIKKYYKININDDEFKIES
jgi:hypothetical protein